MVNSRRYHLRICFTRLLKPNIQKSRLRNFAAGGPRARSPRVAVSFSATTEARVCRLLSVCMFPKYGRKIKQRRGKAGIPAEVEFRTKPHCVVRSTERAGRDKTSAGKRRARKAGFRPMRATVMTRSSRATHRMDAVLCRRHSEYGNDMEARNNPPAAP
jgi:hypothetical protein